ncbi:MAG TPA: eL32 family ribosomal protein [Candidatus Nanoarchaeia archaeon]|nr:eL32 family ribosomal protein [Candidatus Nanoarchaeia archaeon]
MTKRMFLRRNTTQYSRLGRKRKKLQKWRRPTGRDNKMRLKVKGKGPVVSIGYKKDLRERGKSKGMEIKTIKNISDIKNADKKFKYSLGKIGGKKKIEIAKISKEKGIDFVNFNYNKLLKSVEKNKTGRKKEEKK